MTELLLRKHGRLQPPRGYLGGDRIWYRTDDDRGNGWARFGVYDNHAQAVGVYEFYRQRYQNYDWRLVEAP